MAKVTRKTVSLPSEIPSDGQVSMTTNFFDISDNARVLVLEENIATQDSLCNVLNDEGFLTTAANAKNARDLLKQEVYELIILDRKLKGLNCFDLCRELRMKNIQSIILIINDENVESDCVLGLEVGADDYLVKPFGNREFVARCRAMLRRHPLSRSLLDKFECCDLELIPEECRATRGGKDLKLSPKEYKLLELFIQNPKRVWSRDDLIDQIWGINYIGDRKTVDVHIRWLREKIEANPSDPTKLSTVRGFGYRFC